MKRTLLFILLILTFVECKKKEPKTNDPAWKIESVKIAESLCSQMKKCSEGKLENLNDSLKSYSESRMFTANCIGLHKKSRVYHLQKYSPELIKSVTRQCFSESQKLSCTEIIGGRLDLLESCVKMRKIQKGILENQHEGFQ